MFSTLTCYLYLGQIFSLRKSAWGPSLTIQFESPCAATVFSAILPHVPADTCARAILGYFRTGTRANALVITCTTAPSCPLLVRLLTCLSETATVRYAQRGGPPECGPCNPSGRAAIVKVSPNARNCRLFKHTHRPPKGSPCDENHSHHLYRFVCVT